MTNEARVKLFKLLQNVYRKEKDYRSVVIWENKLQNDIKKKLDKYFGYEIKANGTRRKK
jgi:hypothetical protein